MKDLIKPNSAITLLIWRHLDLRLIFHCKPGGRSGALVFDNPRSPLLVEIDRGTDVNSRQFTKTLIHELGSRHGGGEYLPSSWSSPHHGRTKFDQRNTAGRRHGI